MFAGWSEHPPTNILLKGLLSGFGGGAAPKVTEEFSVDPVAMKAMQDSALQEIGAKAGNRLPIVRGRDRGLPTTPPVFDLDAMREKNNAKRLALLREKAKANG